MVGGAEGTVDLPAFTRMVDQYMKAGFCYFDTAIIYLGGQSETALREALVGRYPRDRFCLTDKLSGSQFATQEEILPLFSRQLNACGVDYFDYYLMHGLSEGVYEKFLACNAFQVVRELKAQGKVRHMGISFHDKPQVLERILREQPDIEVVQIQLNYLDYDDPSIESGGVYRVCRKFGKPIFVMEPVKGGGLAALPPEAAQCLEALHGGSPASYALRYVAQFPGVEMVLSGMSSEAQMLDNLQCMEAPQPLTEQEWSALEQVRTILRNQNTVACTACRYCTAGCPQHISIPDLFACLNTQRVYQDWSSGFYYTVHTKDHGKASDCIGCGQCEGACPQHLPIISLLQQVAQVFEG
jgi:hypothetical protein